MRCSITDCGTGRIKRRERAVYQTQMTRVRKKAALFLAAIFSADVFSKVKRKPS